MTAPYLIHCRACGYGNTIDDIVSHEVPGAWWCARCGALATGLFGFPETGPLDLGIEREVDLNRRNDFQMFHENFEGLVQSGCSTLEGVDAFEAMGSPAWVGEALDWEFLPRRRRWWRRLKRRLTR